MRLITHGRGDARRRLRLLAVTAGIATAAIAAVATAGVASASGGVTGYTIVHGAASAITPGQTVGANVACPSGKVVLSGGVSAHSPLTFIRSSFPLSSRTWAVVVTDTGIETYTEHFTPYAVCVNAASVPGIHQVATARLPVGPATYYGPNIAAADAYCSSGEVVVGGGVRSDNKNALLTVSRPTPDTQAWEVYVHLTVNPPVTAYYTVFSVCIPSADVSSYAIDTAASGAYGTFLDLSQPGAAATSVPPGVFNTAASGFCGAGQLAVAGGATNHDQTNGFISSVVPDASGKYWLATSTDINPPTSYSEYFLPTAVCVAGTT